MTRRQSMAGVALALAAARPEDQIRAVLQRQQEAWNRGDVSAFMEGYEDAGSTTFAGKELTRGYQEVLQNYRRRYPSRAHMGTLAFSRLEVRMLGAGHALVIGRWNLQRDSSAGGAAGGLFTLVFARRPAGWRIIHDHTS